MENENATPAPAYVTIDGFEIACACQGYAPKWNGFDTPIFTRPQMIAACEALEAAGIIGGWRETEEGFDVQEIDEWTGVAERSRSEPLVFVWDGWTWHACDAAGKVSE